MLDDLLTVPGKKKVAPPIADDLGLAMRAIRRFDIIHLLPVLVFMPTSGDEGASSYTTYNIYVYTKDDSDVFSVWTVFAV